LNTLIESPETTLGPITRLSRDLRKSAGLMSRQQARYLVDTYYQIQEFRKASANQLRSIGEEEPNEVLNWLSDQMQSLETQIKGALDRWSSASDVGVWAKSICGIGPVIASGLMAHIDIEKAPTAGHIWRFAGLDPTSKWGKGEKRPWNASLKVLTWKIGESFVKVSNNDDDVYGKIYADRKTEEQRRNDANEFASQAATILAEKRIGKDTDAFAAYSIGKLPPAHIHARAKRYAVKMFLAHFQHVAYRTRFGVDPPKPYVIEHLGHAHYVAPPNWSPQE
jgi:hypothetical protein